MTYAKLDHRILVDERTEGLSDNAFALFVKLIVWSSREESDGKIPSKVVRKLGKPRAKVELFLSGLCSEFDQKLVINTYLSHQTSSKAIKVKRAAAKDRKDKFIESKNAVPSPFPSSKATENKETKNKDPKGVITQKKTICPPDWIPTGKDFNKCRAEGLSPDDITETMRDWSVSKSERRVDWDATFRGFVRRDAKELKGRLELEDRKDARYGVNANTERDKQVMAKDAEKKRIQESERAQFNKNWNIT